MSYIKTTWVTGDIVTAPRMNNMEGGIYNNDAAISALQTEVTDTEADVTTLQGNVTTLQTNVTNLQTTTGNLVPSIADVFSTSSTYAVGDHVMYNGRLYECKTAVTSAGAWNASAWEAISVFKYDDVVGVIKITNTSTTMATIETTLAEINTANDHIVFDVSVLSAGMHLCTIYLSDGKYRITDLATGFDGEGLYSGTDTLVSILQKGSAPFYNVSTEPYTFRPINAGIGDKESLDSIVGGSLGWNQLVHNLTSRSAVQGITRTVSSDGTSMTYTGTATTTDNYTAFAFYPVVGHKYLMTLGNVTLPTGAKIVGATQDKATSILVNITTSAYSLGITINSGVVCNFTIQPMAIDLTEMFGTTIADYIYSLESSAAGSGIAWLRQYIDIDSYHEYDAGSIQSVQATEHVTTGFNQFDEVVEAGYWDASTGQKASGGNWMRCANYIPVLPNTEYKIHFTSGSGSQGNIIYLDGNKSVISYISSYIGAVITTPPNCRYMVFYANNGWFGGNICINISKTTGTPKNGDYVPYATYTYPLGSDTLRGVPQLVNNKLAFDGDEKAPDGTIKRKYGIVDLGTLNWSYSSSDLRFVTTGLSLAKTISNVDEVAKMICSRYPTSAYRYVDGRYQTDKIIGLYGTGSTNYLAIKDTAYTDATTLKNSLSGVYLVYPLAAEVTESSTAYQRVQEAPQGGTEAFITNTIVPVGHSTRNPGNMLAAIELAGSEEENPVYSLDSTPYTARMVENVGIIGKESLNKLVGGSLGWNQLVQSNITLTFATTDTNAKSAGNMPIIANHIYIMVYRQSATLTSALRNTPFYNDGTSTYKTTATNTNLSAGIYQWIFKPSNSKSDGYVGMWCYTPNVSVTYDNIMLQDLTATFGSTIADYVYGLEQATVGAGVAWLRKYIDIDSYHAYDAGSIQSVQATAHVTTGKNLIDQTQFVQGSITGSGVDSAVTIRLRSPFVKVSPNTQYSLSVNSEVLLFEVHQYDANKNWLGYLAVNATSYTFTTRSDAEYIKLLIRYSNNATIVVSALTALQMQFGSTATAYEPYTAHTYPLGSDTLRGIPQLVNNELTYDGDVKTADGTITRNYKIVTYNGSESWAKDETTTYAHRFYVVDNAVKRYTDYTNKMIATVPIASGYLPQSTVTAPLMITAYSYTSSPDNNWVYMITPVSGDIDTVEELKAYLAAHPVTAVLPLVTPTTESGTAYKYMQTISADGMESFTTSSPVPVGHETAIPENTLGAIALVAGD